MKEQALKAEALVQLLLCAPVVPVLAHFGDLTCPNHRDLTGHGVKSVGNKLQSQEQCYMHLWLLNEGGKEDVLQFNLLICSRCYLVGNGRQHKILMARKQVVYCSEL